MAILEINYPDAQQARIIDGLCTAGGWRSIALDGARGAFARRFVADFVRSTVAGVESDKVRAAAMAQIVEPEPPTIT